MHPAIDPTPPLAIGGIGGSGTRLIATIAARLGFYLGADLNTAEDNQAFSLLFKRQELWPPQDHQHDIAQAWAAFDNTMTRRRSWTGAEQAYLHTLAQSPRPRLPVDWLAWRVKVMIDQAPADAPPLWGWKEPNTHIVLPQLLELVPGLKYIHVMRNGLDMAYSDNQEQLLYWGKLMLGEEQLEINPANSFRYWCAAHRRLLEMIDQRGKQLYLLNFDQFCLQPQTEIDLLLDFLDINPPAQLREDLLSLITVPSSLGRHKQHRPDYVSAEDRLFLREMGYTSTVSAAQP
jgi:hypothetical protein